MSLLVEFLDNERRQKNEALKALGSLQRLYEAAVHDFNLTFDALQRRNGELLRSRDALEVELASLRPSEPKFKVGQVVSYNNSLSRVTEMAWCGEYWVYTIKGQNFTAHKAPEDSFRALTDEERGL